MKNNIIKDCVDGIEFTEESKQRILNGITEKQNHSRKKSLSKVRFRIAIAALLAIVCIVSSLLQNTNNIVITVCAMTQEGNEKSTILSFNKEITLMANETPVGYGYVFDIDIPNGFSFECKAVGAENDVFAIYINGNKIYWIPTQKITGNVYNSENEKLNTDSFEATSKCQFEIIIYDKNKEISENKLIEFKVINEKCKVVLKE